MAQVVSIRGTAFVVGLDGQTRPLKVGDKIQKGETIVTSAGGGVELAMDDGRPLSLGPQQTVKVDESLTATARPTPAESSVGDGSIDTVIQALDRGGDLTEELEATAAGPTSAGADGAAGGGHVRAQQRDGAACRPERQRDAGHRHHRATHVWAR